MKETDGRTDANQFTQDMSVHSTYTIIITANISFHTPLFGKMKIKMKLN